MCYLNIFTGVLEVSDLAVCKRKINWIVMSVPCQRDSHQFKCDSSIESVKRWEFYVACSNCMRSNGMCFCILYAVHSNLGLGVTDHHIHPEKPLLSMNNMKRKICSLLKSEKRNTKQNRMKPNFKRKKFPHTFFLFMHRRRQANIDYMKNILY